MSGDRFWVFVGQLREKDITMTVHDSEFNHTDVSSVGMKLRGTFFLYTFLSLKGGL